MIGMIIFMIDSCEHYLFRVEYLTNKTIVKLYNYATKLNKLDYNSIFNFILISEIETLEKATEKIEKLWLISGKILCILNKMELSLREYRGNPHSNLCGID